MELREIRSFLLIAKSGSIAETARQLHLTPGAVHKHLKTLERELGARIYQKTLEGLRLTPAGAVIRPYFQDVLDRCDAAVNALTDWKEDATGMVRVGAGPSFSSYMLPGVLSRFRRKHSKIEVFVETGNGSHLLEGLRRGDLDLIFDLEDPQAASEFVAMAEWESRIGIVSGFPDLPQRCRMKQLQRTPFILFQKGSRIASLIDAHFERIGFQPNVVMRSDSAEAIKAMVKNRLGIAMLFLWNANAEYRTGSLRVIHTDAPPLAGRMALLRRRTAYVPQALSAFADVARRMNWKNLHPLSPNNGSGQRGR
jgi:LysR family transcriptional activator of glutamate synthase operon